MALGIGDRFLARCRTAGAPAGACRRTRSSPSAARSGAAARARSRAPIPWSWRCRTASPSSPACRSVRSWDAASRTIHSAGPRRHRRGWSGQQDSNLRQAFVATQDRSDNCREGRQKCGGERAYVPADDAPIAERPAHASAYQRDDTNSMPMPRPHSRAVHITACGRVLPGRGCGGSRYPLLIKRLAPAPCCFLLLPSCGLGTHARGYGPAIRGQSGLIPASRMMVPYLWCSMTIISRN